MVFVYLAVLFQSASVVLGKYASLSVGSVSVLNIATNGYYLLSLLCLLCQAVVWQIALKTIPLSRAYFFMSGVYLAALLASRFLFHEQVTLNNWIGAAVIVAGMVVLLRGSADD